MKQKRGRVACCPSFCVGLGLWEDLTTQAAPKAPLGAERARSGGTGTSSINRQNSGVRRRRPDGFGNMKDTDLAWMVAPSEGVMGSPEEMDEQGDWVVAAQLAVDRVNSCLLYTSPSPRDS